MKNFITITTTIFLFISTINIFAQTLDKYIDVTQEEGILFYEQPDTGLIDFHSDSMASHLILRATYQSDTNNLIITSQGLVKIGSIDLIDTYLTEDNKTKLRVENGDAIGSSWLTFSDQQLKKDILPYEEGLSILNQLNIYEYEYNGLAGTRTDKKYLGVMAQELIDILPHSVSSFNSKLNAEDEETSSLYAINPTDLIYVAINGIKELNSQTTLLERKTKELEEQNEAFKNLENKYETLSRKLDKINAYLALEETGENLSSNKTSLSNDLNEKAISQQSYLKQCIPNPAQKSTTIDYNISDEFGNAKIVFYNLKGQIVDAFIINQKGVGSIVWQPQNLSKGIYTYSLIVDDQVVDSKKVVLE